MPPLSDVCRREAKRNTMKLRNIITTVALAGSAFALAACGSVEGTYKLDKAEMKKSMEAEIAKMPADQQGMAKLALAMIDAMDMSIELKSGGKAEMKASMPGLTEKGKDESKTGEWRKEGDKVIIKGDGKEMTCATGGGKLTCESGKPGEPKVVLIKS